MAREPGYCLHKPSGKAYVNLGGKVHYLGVYGSDKSKELYGRLKAEWLVNRHSGKFKPKANAGPTIADVCNAFLDHAETYYANSSEYQLFERAVQPLSDLYAKTPALNFGTTEFKVCRNWWLSDPKRSRVYVNKQMKRMIHLFKWSAGMGLVPASVFELLRCVAPLKRGRCDAKECEPVKPVSAELVSATLPYLTTVVADMVRIQGLIGCRPGELVTITPAMVNRTNEVWTITLAKHKTAYRGKQRTLYVGPQAQAILSKYLLRGADAPCFSPIESDRERRQAQHEARVTPLSCGNRPGTNRIARKPRRAPGIAFTTGTFGRSVLNACRRAKIDCWSPNQLRHSAATSIRKEFGIEAAQVILGHSQIGVTQVYAERDTAKAIAVAKAVG
ncbi:MAG TPA: site-specific integrase [Pirellula sp.]|nr:site-specific integrase [Pirellula sp.]